MADKRTPLDILTQAGISLRCPKCGKQIEATAENLTQEVDAGLIPLFSDGLLIGLQQGTHKTITWAVRCSCDTEAHVVFRVPRENLDCKAADGSL
jgi:hypothetical protein